MFKPAHLQNILFPILICFGKISFRSPSLTKSPQKIRWDSVHKVTEITQTARLINNAKHSYLTLGAQLKGQFTCKEASSHYQILSFDGH
jgi:hypothetical protein